MDTNIEVLLKRVTLFLEDGDWAKANEYCERVLDQDPENAEAYLGKLLAELRVRSRAELSKLSISFAENKNYQKALRYGNEALQTELTAAQDAAKAAQVAKEAAAKAEAESKAKAATEAAKGKGEAGRPHLRHSRRCGRSRCPRVLSRSPGCSTCQTESQRHNHFGKSLSHGRVENGWHGGGGRR